jgi:putative membrane protein PagO
MLPRGRALAYAAGYGFFQFGVNFPLLYWGELVVPSGLSAILFATIPLDTALFTRLFGLESWSVFKLGGAVVALLGVGLIFSDQWSAQPDLMPILAILVAAISASFGAVLLKRGPSQSAIGANAVGTTVGAAVCLGVSYAIGEPHPMPATLEAWFPILYLTLASSIGAFVLTAWLLRRWEATRVSFIAVIVPVLALILGVWIRHERWTGFASVGSGLVLMGVLVALLPERRSRSARDPAGPRPD